MTTQTVDLTDPLFGPLPSWRLGDDAEFWETAAKFGWAPAPELEERVIPYPAEAVEDASAVAEDDTRPIPLRAFTERAAGLAVAS